MAGDIYYSNVSLLVNGNGTNGSTTLTDNSTHSNIFTAFGNAQISTTQSKFGGSSIKLDDTGAPCARDIRILERSTSKLVGMTNSNASTGYYLCYIPSVEVQRIVLDDSSGNLYNDILDRITPS